PAADREPERARRQIRGLRRTLEQREGCVELGRGTWLEASLLEERELRKHHEIATPSERLGQPAGLRIVVACARRTVREHDPGMAIGPTGPPPGHPHLDACETLTRVGLTRRWTGGGRKVRIPERGRVDVRDDDGGLQA